MTDRYERLALVPCIGRPGIDRLRSSTVLLIGVGGVGAPLLPHLVGSGVGTIIICDYDSVSLSNLHRQTVHTEQGAADKTNKGDSAASFAHALNSEVNVVVIKEAVDAGRIAQLVTEHHVQVIVDCADNAATRYAASDAAAVTGTPLMSISAIRDTAQYAWYVRAPNGDVLPCRRCLAPRPPPPAAVPLASTAGVLGATAAVGSSFAGAEILRFLAGQTDSSAGSLVSVGMEGGAPTLRKLKFRPQNPQCTCARGEEGSIDAFKACPNTPF